MSVALLINYSFVSYKDLELFKYPHSLQADPANKLSGVISNSPCSGQIILTFVFLFT